MSNVIGRVLFITFISGIYSLNIWNRNRFNRSGRLHMKQTEVDRQILVGINALKSLKDHARRSVGPLSSIDHFVDFMNEIVSRKLSQNADKEFKAKIDIRDLRRQHTEVLKRVDKNYKDALNLFSQCKAFTTLKSLDSTIKGANQAVISMAKFIEDTLDGKHERQKEKCESVRMSLPLKRQQLEQDEAKRRELRARTPEYGMLLQAIAEKEALYQSLGLLQKGEEMRQMSRGGGLGRNSRGKDFEVVAYEALLSVLMPMVIDEYLSEKVEEEADEYEYFAVRNIKFGMASAKGSTAEFDSLICRRLPRSPTYSPSAHEGSNSGGSETNELQPGTRASEAVHVEVLAVCEVKRNPDDLGDAFESYQPSLRWLCGLQDEYDSADYVTKAYPRGHFDREFYHTLPKGKGVRGASLTLVFTADSFSRVKASRVQLPSDSPLSSPLSQSQSIFPSSLYFITRHGRLDCVSSKAMAWALDKVANDEILGPGAYLLGSDDSDNERKERTAAMESIRSMTALRYPSRMHTFELLRMYERFRLENQVMVI